MRLRLLHLLSFMGLILPGPAMAFQETTYSTETFNKTFVYPDIPKFSPPPAGGLGWDIFTTTTEDYTYGTGAQANYILAARPAFTKEMQALDGQDVLMSGYMFPLEDADNQSQFLFGPFPMSCPFHYHVPPTLVIEAHAKTPIAFTYEPIQLRGKLELVKDLGHEPYYRLHDAVVDNSQSIVQTQAKDAPQKSFHPLFHASPMEVRKRGGVTPDAPSADDYKVQ